jgi:small-conductance mechanosensitive channel
MRAHARRPLSAMLAVLQNLQPDTMLLAQNATTQTGTADATVTSTFTERLEHSFAMLGEFVPALFGALVILFAGYLVAKLIEKGTQRILRRVRFNQMLERGGVMQAVERSGSNLNPAKVIANVLFWFVMFAVLLVAANAIGLESLANVFSELVSYIPSVIAAIVIIILGIVLGGFVGGLIMASAGGLHGGPWLARTGRGGVIVLAVFMALQELGIATDIVTTAFAILFGAVALALALAFGLGNRDLAAEVTREWYQRYRAERMAIDAEAAAEEAEELAEEASDDASDAASEETAEMPVPAAAAKGRVGGPPAETVRS